VRERFLARLKSFDFAADQALERHRGNRRLGRMFSTASHVANHGVLWHVIGLVYSLAFLRNIWGALLFVGLIGIESLIVNQGIKRIFRRVRPTQTGDPRFRVRKPQSSSFPSGHASSAFFAGTVLTVWISPWSLPLWLVLAVVVAVSRAYVRIHHPSDVVAGAVTGLVLGGVAVLTPALDVLRG
jgi:undecaprenyl-diphosphatase